MDVSCGAPVSEEPRLERKQRRDPRRLLMLRADVREDGHREPLASAWTADVSAGGVSLRGAANLQRGHIVRMSLSFPGLLEPMDVLGDVVWAERTLAVSGGVGVRVWSKLDRERLSRLADIVVHPQSRRVRPYRVVVMESDPLTALSYRIALDELHPVAGGHLEVTMTRSWDETHGQLEATPADMIVLGLHPRYRDSRQALAFVRDNAAHAGSIVVALSAADDPDLVRHANLVADATFLKPVPIARIIDTIGHLLNQRAFKHQNVAYV
jgi:hypothetical protein